MKKRMFAVELYGYDDLLIEEFMFQTKAEQLEKYYNLIQEYPRENVIKLTRWFYY